MSKTILFSEIRKLIPYAPPFLLIDKIIDWEENNWLLAKKVVSGSDPLIYAHLINGPSVLPGVIQIELIGQACLLLNVLSNPGTSNDINVLAKCKADFYGSIQVGDTIDIKVFKEAEVQNKVVMTGELSVEGVTRCKAELYSASLKF